MNDNGVKFKSYRISKNFRYALIVSIIIESCE